MLWKKKQLHNPSLLWKGQKSVEAWYKKQYKLGKDIPVEPNSDMYIGIRVEPNSDMYTHLVGKANPEQLLKAIPKIIAAQLPDRNARLLIIAAQLKATPPKKIPATLQKTYAQLLSANELIESAREISRNISLTDSMLTFLRNNSPNDLPNGFPDKVADLDPTGVLLVAEQCVKNYATLEQKSPTNQDEILFLQHTESALEDANNNLLAQDNTSPKEAFEEATKQLNPKDNFFKELYENVNNRLNSSQMFLEQAAHPEAMAHLKKLAENITISDKMKAFMKPHLASLPAEPTIRTLFVTLVMARFANQGGEPNSPKKAITQLMKNAGAGKKSGNQKTLEDIQDQLDKSIQKNLGKGPAAAYATKIIHGITREAERLLQNSPTHSNQNDSAPAKLNK